LLFFISCLVWVPYMELFMHDVIEIDCVTQMFDQHISQNKLGHGTFHA